MEGEKGNYWCYVCDKQYTFQVDKKATVCWYCDSDAIQIMSADQSENENPSHFQVFKVEKKEKPRVIGQLQNGVYAQRNQTRTMISLGSTILNGSSAFAEGSYLGNLFNQLIGSGSRIKSATKDQISKLEGITTVKECAICQEEEDEENIQGEEESAEMEVEERRKQQEGKEEKKQQKKEEETKYSGYRLPCQHEFHQDCIAPWFQKSSTCPVCRKSIVKESA